MADRQTCVDCNILAPETDTNYTLIGSRHGWRLTRRVEPDGRAVPEWRCQACWRVYKATSSEKKPRRITEPRRTPGRSAPPQGSRKR